VVVLVSVLAEASLEAELKKQGTSFIMASLYLKPEFNEHSWNNYFNVQNKNI